jgi:hypothetical protein
MIPKAAPWWAGPASAFGGELLGGLAGLFAGPTESQKSSRKVFNLAQNRLGQSVLDPTQYLAQYMQSLAPQFNRQAEGINRRLGLDSGLAEQILASTQQSTLSGILADLTRFNAQATANQDLGLMRLMMQAGARS